MATVIRFMIALATCLLTVIALPEAEETHELGKRCCTEGQGLITAPSSGTNILPGASFPFTYVPRNGRYYTSLNFTVMLLTSEPGSTPDNSFYYQMLAGNGDATGYYFGRFGIDSVGNPFPSNPVPATLNMPDFSQAPWNSGSLESYRVYLGVLEEWVEGATVGKHLSLTANWLTYNASTAPPPFAPPFCDPPYPIANGRCGCQFNSYCGYQITNMGSDIVNVTYPGDLTACQNACDSQLNCYAYMYEQPAFSCTMYSTVNVGWRLPTQTRAYAVYAGVVAKRCKDQCPSRLGL